MRLIYQRLTDYILQKLPKAYHGNFYSFMTDGEVINEGKNYTANSNILFYVSYKTQLLFAALPYQHIAPLRLLAQIKLWLDENDTERERLDEYNINYDLEIIDDSTADFAIELSFTEPIYAKQIAQSSAPEDELEIDGELYQLTNRVEIDVAENIFLSTNGSPLEKVERE